MREATKSLIQQYYAAFNAQHMEGFLALLSDDVVHDVNQGPREVGKTAFARFMERMNRCYREHIYDLEIMINDDGSRAATEFTVLGVYLATDEGLPEAHGQTYRLPGGAFFEIADGKIKRITNYYNLQDWLAQVAFQEGQAVTEEGRE
ncbi:MAG TPA: ketosteroid isomerase-related protein [Candidatus Competibacteraceae bacterium]|nr:ketosteroid isomerase-related protein [Candidatus Competibacteraceae bacterium]